MSKKQINFTKHIFKDEINWTASVAKYLSGADNQNIVAMGESIFYSSKSLAWSSFSKAVEKIEFETFKVFLMCEKLVHMQK